MAEDYKQMTLSNFRAEKDFYTVTEMSEIYKGYGKDSFLGQPYKPVESEMMLL